MFKRALTAPAEDTSSVPSTHIKWLTPSAAPAPADLTFQGSEDNYTHGSCAQIYTDTKQAHLIKNK